MDNAAQINTVHPQLETWGDTVKLDDVMMQFYISPDSISALVLTSVNGYFVKLRITAYGAQEFDKCVKETIADFRLLANHCRKPQKENSHEG